MLLLLDLFNQYSEAQVLPKETAFDTGSEMKVGAIAGGIKTGSLNDSQQDDIIKIN